MKKLLMIAIVVAVLASLIATPVLAKGKDGPAGKSNVGHLYLYTKDYTDPTWPIIPGAWGKMKFNLAGPTFDFVFNGHELDAGSSYTLIYYPDPWPGTGLIYLGSGAANADGDVHIMGSVNTGDLTSAKIWLVLSSDVDCSAQKMVGWTPAKYLFEHNLITYTDVP